MSAAGDRQALRDAHDDDRQNVRAVDDALGVENVVAILDQNLNYIDGDVYGTDLVRRLRGEFAWRGAILIQSANCETSDVRE